MTGCAAALIKGLTLHLETNFESANKKIPDADRTEWKNVIILVIDEISFMSQGQLEKLDKMLRRLRCEQKKNIWWN